MACKSKGTMHCGTYPDDLSMTAFLRLKCTPLHDACMQLDEHNEGLNTTSHNKQQIFALLLQHCTQTRASPVSTQLGRQE